MANVVSSKVVKIKPENQVVAEGEVVKCKYAGASSVGIGPFAKTTHLYKVFIKVEGVEKPLVLKVKEKQDWNVGIVDNINAMNKMFGGPTPVNEGDKLTVAYDRTKPKKCNIVE